MDENNNNNNNDNKSNKSLMDMLMESKWSYVIMAIGALTILIGLAQGNSNNDSTPSRSESEYNLNNEEDLNEYIEGLDWDEQSNTDWSDN